MIAHRGSHETIQSLDAKQDPQKLKLGGGKMKKITICLMLIVFLIGCGGMRCYQIKNCPNICVDRSSKINEKAKDFLISGQTLIYTIKKNYTGFSDRVTSCYVKETGVLYSVDDILTILTQVYYIEHEVSPPWDIGNVEIIEKK